MDRSLTFDDPNAYTRPWTISMNVDLMPDTELLEYVCNENERDLQHFVITEEDRKKNRGVKREARRLLRRRPADQAVDHGDQGVQALVGVFLSLGQLFHFFAQPGVQLLHVVRQQHLSLEQLPVLVLEFFVGLQKLRLAFVELGLAFFKLPVAIFKLPVVFLKCCVVLDQQIHEPLHAIQPGLPVRAVCVFRHGSIFSRSHDRIPQSC